MPQRIAVNIDNPKSFVKLEANENLSSTESQEHSVVGTEVYLFHTRIRIPFTLTKHVLAHLSTNHGWTASTAASAKPSTRESGP